MGVPFPLFMVSRSDDIFQNKTTSICSLSIETGIFTILKTVIHFDLEHYPPESNFTGNGLGDILQNASFHVCVR